MMQDQGPEVSSSGPIPMDRADWQHQPTTNNPRSTADPQQRQRLQSKTHTIEAGPKAKKAKPNRKEQQQQPQQRCPSRSSQQPTTVVSKARQPSKESEGEGRCVQEESESENEA